MIWIALAFAIARRNTPNENRNPQNKNRKPRDFFGVKKRCNGIPNIFLFHVPNFSQRKDFWLVNKCLKVWDQKLWCSSNCWWLLAEVIATLALVHLSIAEPSHMGLDKISHLFPDQDISLPLTPFFSWWWEFNSRRQHHCLLPSLDVELSSVFSKSTVCPGSHPSPLIPCAKMPKFSAQLLKTSGLC